MKFNYLLSFQAVLSVCHNIILGLAAIARNKITEENSSYPTIDEYFKISFGGKKY